MTDFLQDKKHWIHYHFSMFGKLCYDCDSTNIEKFRKTFNNIWTIIHSLAFQLKEDISTNQELSILVYGFFNVDVKKIPCSNCRNHYITYLAQHPMHSVKNNLDLQKWTVDLHNDVNRRNGKPTFSFSDAKNLYS
jgi:hypothetical protein